MQMHHLKTWPRSFVPLIHGDKRAEFRLNDRDYKEGDLLFLEEFIPNKEELYCYDDWEAPDVPGYTGRYQLARVSHVLKGPDFGVPANYVVLSIERMELVKTL